MKPIQKADNKQIRKTQITYLAKRMKPKFPTLKVVEIEGLSSIQLDFNNKSILIGYYPNVGLYRYMCINQLFKGWTDSIDKDIKMIGYVSNDHTDKEIIDILKRTF
jgi:hypothetical protein